MQPIAKLSVIADKYDALLLDLWGVVHDGTHLYPNVHETLVQLRKAGKKIIMLSNAPRRAKKVEDVLHQLGIESSLYDFVLSSGEAGYHWLASDKNKLGSNYYYIGPSKDLDVANGLKLMRVDDLKDADFLLNVGFGSEEQTTDDWMPLLRAAKASGLPMVCLNPDLEVVKITGARFACAGVLAQNYQTMGGKVEWFGKPYPAVYEECLELLKPVKKPRLLAIGDSLETDIKGAAQFGIDSVLVTGGILKKHTAAEIDGLCARLGLKPNYCMRELAW